MKIKLIDIGRNKISRIIEIDNSIKSQMLYIIEKEASKHLLSSEIEATKEGNICVNFGRVVGKWVLISE